jgi:mono/diheme cytochrome c family protein
VIVSSVLKASAAALAFSFALAPAVLARDAAAGREKAAQCAVCHGPQGSRLCT